MLLVACFLFGVLVFVFTACCVLFVAGCLLFGVCYVLLNCCLLFVVWCVLLLVCCLLSIVCCLLFAVCCLLFAVSLFFFFIGYLQCSSELQDGVPLLSWLASCMADTLVFVRRQRTITYSITTRLHVSTSTHFRTRFACCIFSFHA